MAIENTGNTPKNQNKVDEPTYPKLEQSGMMASDPVQERKAMTNHKDQLVDDFHELMSSAEALLKSTAKYTGAEIEEARERLEKQLDNARERSMEVGESMLEMKQRLATQADECVHRHPWTCIGIAFLAGIGVGHCVLRR